MPLHNLTLQEPEATRPLTWHPSKPPCLLGQITYAMSDHPMHLCASSLYPTCSQRLLPSITARRRRSHVHTWDSTCQTLHLTFRFYSLHFLSQVCVAFTLQSLLASVPLCSKPLLSVALTWYANCKPYFVACNAYYFLFACCGNVSVSMFPQCSPITTFYFFCGKFGIKRRADTQKKQTSIEKHCVLFLRRHLCPKKYPSDTFS